jgi:hypothetical protein
MNGLTQIKDKDGILYDVNYDTEFQRFIVWEHDKINTDGAYFSSEDINRYVSDGQITIYKDENGLFKKYL